MSAASSHEVTVTPPSFFGCHRLQNKRQGSQKVEQSKRTSRSYLGGLLSDDGGVPHRSPRGTARDLLPGLFAQLLGCLRCSLALIATEPAARARVGTERSIGFSVGGQRIYPVAVCGQTPSTAMGDWICSISSRSRARRTACGSSRWAGRRATRCRRVLPRAIDDKVGSRARGLPSPTCLGKNQ